MKQAKLAPAFLLIVAIALTIVYFASPASAETITVTRADDPAPNGCAPSDCSFREATDQANATAGNQVIDIGVLEIVLTSTINITGDLTVSGANTNDSIIQTSNHSQLFNISAGGNATFVDVWIYGASNAGPGGCGGAIYNQGTLSVEHSKIAKNFITGKGAGICNLGTADLDDTLMSADGATGGPGGAIFNSGTMNITNSTITQNTVNGSDGGGIQNDTGGTLTIDHSTISSNTVDLVSCNDCASGGGISNNGTLTLEYSTIANNIADNGAGLVNRGDATIRRSTFTGNQAGAIKNSDGMMTIVRSTISGNLGSPYPASGVGGIENYDTLSLIGNTIADNTNMQFQYGGLFTNTTASTSYKATIFANNGPKNCSTSGGQTSFGYNVYVPAAAACTTVGTDVAAADAMLGSLTNNGGPTQTRLPLAGSPAIDTGGPGCVAPDQRGASIADGHCDAGAVEASGSPATPTPVPSPTPAPESFPMGDVGCSDDVTIADLLPALKLTAKLTQPDRCGREVLPCFNFEGACYPVWDDPDCNQQLTLNDVLLIAAKLADVPITAQCTAVGQYPTS